MLIRLHPDPGGWNEIVQLIVIEAGRLGIRPPILAVTSGTWRFILIAPRAGRAGGPEPLCIGEHGIADPMVYLAPILGRKVVRLPDIGPVWVAEIQPPIPPEGGREERAVSYFRRLGEHVRPIGICLFADTIPGFTAGTGRRCRRKASRPHPRAAVRELPDG